MGGPRASWGVEYILNEAPVPDSVEEIRGPFRRAFIEIPRLPPFFPTLKNKLKDLPPFFRDTELHLKTRTYYFDRRRADNSKNEAWALGGSLDYQSGWFKDFIAVGGEVFTSQELYGPRRRDGTMLLRPGQKEYTVLGRAYGQLRYQGQEATVYRQYYDLPYMNKNDGRMTPNTFEGYSLEGRLPHLEYIVGYVSRMKRRESSTFINMSEAAGVPSNRKRGLFMAGARYSWWDELSMGALNYWVPDVINIVYAEAQYTRAITNELGIQFGTQFTDQRSVGDELLTGSSFDTQVGGTRVALSYKRAILTTAFTITAEDDRIRSPFGGYPGYVSIQLRDFNRANEKAWLVGLSYDFEDLGLEGLSFFINYVRGQEARDVTTGDSLPDQDEFDITIDYRFEKGPLRGFWLRMRAAFVDFNRDGGAVNNFRVNLSHDFSLL